MELNTEYGKIRVLEKGASLVSWEHNLDGKTVSLLHTPSYDPKIVNYDYSGSIVGPRAGRYLLNEKDGIELHSGNEGVSDKLFRLTEEGNSIKAEITYNSVSYEVVYTLDKKGLDIKIRMTGDSGSNEKLLINPTSHLYFSINGKAADEHVLSTGTCVVTVKKDSLPSGIAICEDDLDFLNKRKIGSTHIDDCYILADDNLTLSDGNIKLELKTDAPAAVVYTYDFPKFQEDLRSAIAIEPQDPPNSQNYDPCGCLHHFLDHEFTRQIRWEISKENQ